MDSQRRFEGPDLEALLAQVQRECGTEATILEANKLRAGGVGGFFAKERFEVIVEMPAAPSQDTTSAAEALQTALAAATIKPTPPRTITTTPKVWTTPDATPPAGDASAPSKAASHLEDAVMAAIAAADSSAEEVAGAAPATSILELAEQRNREERSTAQPVAPATSSTPAPSPMVSTEGPAFAEVLGQLAREALREQTTDDDSAGFVPLAEEAATLTTEASPEPVPPVLPRVEMTTASSPSTTSMPIPTNDVAMATEPVLRSDATLARPAPQSPIAAALACLGVPDHLLPVTHARSDLRSELVAALRWLPAPDPLPSTTGSVIAVVGNADHAMAMAQEVARELGCDAREVILAGEAASADTPTWMQLRDLNEAGERRRSWRRRTTPTVVAVAAPLGYDPALWARPMLDALEPTIAWGVVSADRKAEDVRAWIDRLGGVDALALTDTALTVSPATMLQLGIPIARLDGDRADPMTWANLLLGRLAA